jgi:nucleotide-binding universal stress UspA family protein
MRSVVVGLDGGPIAATVVRTAAAEAVRRGLVLDLVTVVGAPTVATDAESWTVRRPVRRLPAPRGDREFGPRWLMARRRLAAAAGEAVAARPELEVRTWCVAQEDLEDPAATGVRLPAAELLVLGALGRNGAPPFGLRSASRLLAKRMGSPVLVVPAAAAAAPPGAPVVVGIRDQGDLEALRTAVTESLRRDAPLVVVLVLATSATPIDPGPGGVLDHVPVPPGTRVIAVADGYVASVLVRVAEREHAQVLVIGTEGTASLAGLARESASRAVTRLSPRPVLLVPSHGQHRHPVAPRAASLAGERAH